MIIASGICESQHHARAVARRAEPLRLFCRPATKREKSHLYFAIALNPLIFMGNALLCRRTRVQLQAESLLYFAKCTNFTSADAGYDLSEKRYSDRSLWTDIARRGRIKNFRDRASAFERVTIPDRIFIGQIKIDILPATVI